MDDKKTAAILLKLLGKYPFVDEEKEAIKTAVGILGWTALAKGRLRKIKEKQEKDKAW